MFSKEITKITLKQEDQIGPLTNKRFEVLKDVIIKSDKASTELQASDGKRLIKIKKGIGSPIVSSKRVSSDVINDLPEKFSLRSGMLSIEAVTKNLDIPLPTNYGELPEEIRNIPDEGGLTSVVNPVLLIELLQVMMANVSERGLHNGLEINVSENGILKMSFLDPSDGTEVMAFQAPVKIVNGKKQSIIGARKIDI